MTTKNNAKNGRKSRFICLLAVVVILCTTLGGCLSIVGSILDNLDAVLNFVNGFGQEKLPENAVYGSKNPLAVGFTDRRLVAFWDEEENCRYDVKVTGDDGITTAYDTEKNADMFDGSCFNLEAAGFGYGDNFTVDVRKTNKKTGLYTDESVDFDGVKSSDYNKYTKNVPGGFTTIDYYIATRYELFEFFAYLIIFRPEAEWVSNRNGSYYQVTAELKIAYDFRALYGSDVSEEAAFEAEVTCASASFEDSAAYNFAYELDSNGVGWLLLKFYYDTKPTLITDSGTIYRNAYSYSERPHYGSYTDNERSFPIDNIKNGVAVESSDQLYFAIKKGYRPIPATGSNAEILYNEMRRILAEINGQNSSAPTKIHNIYDYLVNTVIYDHVFVDEILSDNDESGSELFTYKCLYLEGVFGLANDGSFVKSQRVAICDGLSKAFLCLTRIEGINSVKVSGQASGGAHAWNKVEVDSRWYMVDTTWGNVLEGNKEFLSHDYLMVADDSKHVEDGWYYYPRATGRYSFIFG